MAVGYLIQSARKRAADQVQLSTVVERWTDSSGGEQTTDTFGELERIVAAYLSSEET